MPTVIGKAERVTRGMRRLPTMSDARGSYMSQVKKDVMLVKRANYIQQRCPYDTIPQNIPGSNARGGSAALQHAQVESPHTTWPVTIPINIDPSQGSHSDAGLDKSGTGAPGMRTSLAFPSADWTVRMDRSGRQYYVNKFDKRISWTFPNDHAQNAAGSPTNKNSQQAYVEELEDRILQRYSSDMLVVGEGSKKDFPDPFRDALLNKRVRREERGVMLENAQGQTVMALVEAGRDANCSGAAPSGAAQPGIHQSISRGLTGSTRVLRNLSKANLVPGLTKNEKLAIGSYSLLRHGARSHSVLGEVGMESVAEVAVFDSRPNTPFDPRAQAGASQDNAGQSGGGSAARATSSGDRKSTDRRSTVSASARGSTSMSIDTLGGLPTFNPLAYKSVPTQQRLSDINTKAIILNYPSADWNKSRKGILAPVLDRKDLGDYNMTSRYNFEKRRSEDVGASKSLELGEWSRPITALTPFGIIYPDGTIGPANPENPTFDQEMYTEDLRHQESLSRSLDNAQLLSNRLPQRYNDRFAHWVLDMAQQLNEAPKHVVTSRMESTHLPYIDIAFKHQLEVIKTLYTQGKLSRDVYDGLKKLILIDEPQSLGPRLHAGNISKIELAPKTVRRKGAAWPDDGGNLFREASTTDHKPYAEFRCESPQEEYTTTIKSFNTTVSSHDSQSLRDVRPAGRTTPGGYAGGEAFGNVPEGVQSIEEALTRRTTSPITSVYLPRRMSEVTICHYDPFHGHEKDYQAGLLDFSRPDRLVVSPKVPKTMGVDAVLYDSSRYVEASKIPTKTEVGERIMEPFVKSNWMTVTTQRLMMRKDEVPAMYTRTPGRNIH